MVNGDDDSYGDEYVYSAYFLFQYFICYHNI